MRLFWGKLCALVCCLSACAASEVSESQSEVGGDESNQRLFLSDFCADKLCRKNVTITFNTPNGVFDEFLPNYFPVVQGERLSVLPNEKLFIEAELQNDTLTNYRWVESNQHPDKTLVISLTQMEGALSMLLTLKNPFDVILKYHLDLVDFEGELHPTSSCPVLPGISAFETWPHAIPELIISEVHVIPESQAQTCVY